MLQSIDILELIYITCRSIVHACFQCISFSPRESFWRAHKAFSSFLRS